MALTDKRDFTSEVIFNEAVLKSDFLSHPNMEEYWAFVENFSDLDRLAFLGLLASSHSQFHLLISSGMK